MLDVDVEECYSERPEEPLAHEVSGGSLAARMISRMDLVIARVYQLLQLGACKPLAESASAHVAGRCMLTPCELVEELVRSHARRECFQRAHGVVLSGGDLLVESTQWPRPHSGTETWSRLAEVLTSWMPTAMRWQWAWGGEEVRA